MERSYFIFFWYIKIVCEYNDIFKVFNTFILILENFFKALGHIFIEHFSYFSRH